MSLGSMAILEWLTSRPAPEGFYGMNAFMRSIDTKVAWPEKPMR